ncbi:Hypothetical predicted protein [Mytilus galloprovincialis]|uniref:Uncharacterized protein n=1 Tax=Mytilus galloprovincialis TaxID=29158 RepID=A0A8B6GG53_MYTGA|nr:Hypothetical predicted protein [Mytilus galloprovincialis]
MSTSQKEEPSLLIDFSDSTLKSEDTEKVDSKIDQNIILKSVDTELGEFEEQKTSEAIGGARPRKYIDKGKEFSEEQIIKSYDELKRLSEKIIRLISDNETFETIRLRYGNWMQEYEQFHIQHRIHFDKLNALEQEDYMKIHTTRDTFLMNSQFKIQEYLNANPVKVQASVHGRSVRSAGSSSVSSKRLEVEEKKD